MDKVYDWESNKDFPPQRKTRVACKDCGQIFIRPYSEYGFDVVFIPTCFVHEDWPQEDRVLKSEGPLYGKPK
jgi:hypothetical protein